MGRFALKLHISVVTSTSSSTTGQTCVFLYFFFAAFALFVPWDGVNVTLGFAHWLHFPGRVPTDYTSAQETIYLKEAEIVLREIDDYEDSSLVAYADVAVIPIFLWSAEILFFR